MRPHTEGAHNADYEREPTCPDCGEWLNDDYLSEHRWLWHGGPAPDHSDGSA